MPISIVPTEKSEPKGPAESSPEQETTATGADSTAKSDSKTERSGPKTVRGSRWIDYDTHELLQMIGELEDERRWARLREGVLWAILVHILLLGALFLIPKYLLKLTPVVQTPSINDHKDFTYLDTPTLPKAKPVKPLTNEPLIDKKTMDEMKRQAPPAPTPPQPKPEEQQPPQEQSKVQPPPPPIPPNPQSQSQVEAPKLQSVPAKPNFAMGSQNPADQLHEDMQRSLQNHGVQNYGNQGPTGLPGHPGAGTGAPDILSDTQGVDFSSWLARWHYVTQGTWDPLIPDEVNPPILKAGVVAIRFKVLPNGQVIDMQLDGRSGDTALDRAAWGAISGSSYPALPREFHGPYLELRAYFLYNTEPK